MLSYLIKNISAINCDETQTCTDFCSYVTAFQDKLKLHQGLHIVEAGKDSVRKRHWGKAI